jgi:hypothetical protein
MARAPSAKIHKTSGQGISRGVYQKAYALKNKSGTGIEGAKLTSRFGSGGDDEPKRSYGKSESKPLGGTELKFSYGDTYKPTDLEDIDKMYRERPNPSAMMNIAKPKKIK